MYRISKEEYARKYTDSHVELDAKSLIDATEKSVVREDDGSLTIIGKKQIERMNWEEKSDKLKNFLLDTVAVRSNEAMEVTYDKLLSLACKHTIPQKVEQKVDMNVNSFKSLWDTVEAEDADVLDEE